MERGFEFLEKELAEMYPEPDKETDTRFADKLVKVFNREGQEEWVLTHIEVQGDTSMRLQFSERMFRYFYRILDRYRKPVSAVAIFTGLDGKKMPDRFEYTYRKTKLLYEYHTLSILDFTDEELEKSDNPFAQVVLAAKTSLLEGKIPEPDLLDRKVLIARELLKKGIPRRKIRAIFTFLENYVLFEEPEMNRIFKERIQSQDKNNVMGIDEYLIMVGREEGLAEGMELARREEQEKCVRLFLTNTEFSVDKIANLVGVPVSFAEKIKEEIQSK